MCFLIFCGFSLGINAVNVYQMFFKCFIAKYWDLCAVKERLGKDLWLGTFLLIKQGHMMWLAKT